MKTLVIDIGGTHIKLLATGRRTPVKLDSGPDVTPTMLVDMVRCATERWTFDRVSVGYPGPVRNNTPARDPYNLGPGWEGFDFRRAFGKPVRVINDAAMQALGSYDGGTMLFLGLGTGLGTALIVDGVVVPLELAHLPYERGKSYEHYVGDAGLDRLGKSKWRKHVRTIIDLFREAMQAEYVVLGGGNARHMKKLPDYVRLGSNANAFTGGYRLWNR